MGEKVYFSIVLFPF